MVLGLNKVITDKFNALKETTLSGHFVNNNFLTEADLERRFSKPQAFPHNVSFEFTTDEDDLQQYYDIRENAYRQYLGLKNFSGQKDEFDDNSYILVAKAGQRVVGGVRLTICSKEKSNVLPLESQGYNLESYFPNLDFVNLTHFENSRMAFLPEFRGGGHVLELCKKINEFYINTGTFVGFAIAPLVQARRYKAIFAKLGYHFVIREDIKLPKIDMYGDIQPLLCAADLTSDNRYAAALENFAAEDTQAIERELEPA